MAKVELSGVAAGRPMPSSSGYRLNARHRCPEKDPPSVASKPCCFNRIEGPLACPARRALPDGVPCSGAARLVTTFCTYPEPTPYYASKRGRLSLTPGRYFRMHLV